MNRMLTNRLYKASAPLRRSNVAQARHFHRIGPRLQQSAPSGRPDILGNTQTSASWGSGLPFVVGGAAIFGGALYYLYSQLNPDDQYQIIDITNEYKYRQLKQLTESTFELGVNTGPYGKGDYKTHLNLLQPMEKIEQTLHANEKTIPVNRPGNPVVKIETNVIPTNSPCEDRHSIDIISTDDLDTLLRNHTSKSFWEKWYDVRTKICPNWKNDPDGKIEEGDGSKDLVLISVIDGHGGPKISNLLKQTLHGCLAWALADHKYGSGFLAEQARHLKEGFMPLSTSSLPKDPGLFTQLMKDVFMTWDNSIIQAPLQLIANKISVPPSYPLTAMPSPALAELTFDAGACVITAAIDVANDKMYIAHSGDSRGVAGWFDPKNGLWRCDTLTADHGCENPSEAQRIRDAHPGEEHAVLDQGFTPRIRGNLQPSRAFGDDPLKLTDEVVLQYRQATDVIDHKWDQGPNLTPPYLTAEPDLTVRTLHPDSGEQLKFVLLATDGLFDQMSSEEVVLNLAAHLNQGGSGKCVSKPDLAKAIPFKAPTEPRPFPAEDLPGTGIFAKGLWAFEDANAATHLARNCYGGGDKDKLQMIMSLKDGARAVRDDWTAVVISFEDEGIKVDSV